MKQKLFTRNFTFLILGQASSLIGNNTLKFALSMYVLERTGSAAVFAGLIYRKALAGNRHKETALIEQGYIDAALVGRLGYDIAIARFAQDGVAGKVAYDAVVLDFAQCNECRRRPLADGSDDAGNVVQLLSVFGIVPMPHGIGQEFVIVL